MRRPDGTPTWAVSPQRSRSRAFTPPGIASPGAPSGATSPGAPSGTTENLHQERMEATTRTAECRVYTTLILLGICGAVQLVFAFSIPYLTIGLLGLAVMGGSIALARDLLFQRRRYLLLGIMQPPLTFVIVYTDYVKLAKALDQDGFVATEDDLERMVQNNLVDRAAAYAGVAIDVLVVLLSFALASFLIDLRRAYLGRESSDQPLVLLVLAALGRTAEPPNQRPPVQPVPISQPSLGWLPESAIRGTPWLSSSAACCASAPDVAEARAHEAVARPPRARAPMLGELRPPGRASRARTADLV